MISGTDTVVTFDRLVYSFHSSCATYTAITIPSQGLTVQLNLAVGVLQSIDVTLDGVTMRVKRDFSVLLNNVAMSLPLRDHDFRVIQLTFLTVEVEVFGLVITWTPNVLDELLELRVEPINVGRTFGLCGTFNWNQKDDFLTLAGDVEFSSERFVERFSPRFNRS